MGAVRFTFSSRQRICEVDADASQGCRVATIIIDMKVRQRSCPEASFWNYLKERDLYKADVSTLAGGGRRDFNISYNKVPPVSTTSSHREYKTIPTSPLPGLQGSTCRPGDADAAIRCGLLLRAGMNTWKAR